MSFRLHNQLRLALAAIRKPHHTPAHIAVLEVIAYRINDKTGICFPSVETIAAESFLSERHARKVIRQLEEDGLIAVTERVRKSSHYSLTLPVSVAYAAGQNRLHTEAGLEVPEPGSEATQDGSEARLTYNLNQSRESIKRDVYVLSKDVSATLTSDSEDQTGFPVQRSSKEKVVSGSRAAAVAVCEQLNKIKSKTDFAPSPQDIELLDFLITEHGEQTVSRMVEWLLKGKNPYWRVLLKKSVFPCSRFTSSFNTMLKQINSSNSQAMQKARRTR